MLVCSTRNNCRYYLIMNSSNMHGKSRNLKSISTSKEESSHRDSSKKSVENFEETLDSSPDYYTSNYALSENSSCSYKNSCAEIKRVSPAPWVKTFMHRSARYAEFLASQDRLEKSKALNHKSTQNPVASAAASASAERYARIKRTSSGPLTWRRACCNQVPSIEWALNELLMADKWLHEKYGPTAPVAAPQLSDRYPEATATTATQIHFETTSSPRACDPPPRRAERAANALQQQQQQLQLQQQLQQQQQHPLDSEGVAAAPEEESADGRYDYGGKKARNAVEEKSSVDFPLQLRGRTLPATRIRPVRGNVTEEDEGSGGGSAKRDMLHPSRAMAHGCFKTLAGRFLAMEV